MEPYLVRTLGTQTTGELRDDPQVLNTLFYGVGMENYQEGLNAAGLVVS